MPKAGVVRMADDEQIISALEHDDPLLPTKEDQELLRIEQLKNDVKVRHRRLSQLEDYMARVEQEVNSGQTSDETNSLVIDEELNRIFSQLEEEIEWGDELDTVSAAVSAGIPEPSKDSMRTMLEAAFKTYDQDGDGQLSRVEFERYAKDTFPENMAKFVTVMFDNMDENKDGLIQLDEFLRTYMTS